MALTERQKKGIGYMISGAVFELVGAVLYFAAATPPWVSVVLGIVALVASYFGFTTVFPNETD